MTSLLHRKPLTLEALAEHQRLKPTLDWRHLIPLGVGAIVGTGIYTLIGVGAHLAGPAVILSFLIAGAVCACAALAYAEVAAMIPASGSAYTYSYVALGEIVAWVVGWSLILEYSLVVSAVAKSDMPVMLPPGCARLSISLVSTGSPRPTAPTVGMPVDLAASAAG